MKTLNYLIILIAGTLLLGACNSDDGDTWNEGTGIVEKGNETPSACETVIHLAGGSSVIPVQLPSGVELIDGQRVWVRYIIIPMKDRSCTNGINCQVLELEDVTCESYIDINFSNYDSLAYDPVMVNEMYVDGDCLYLDLSYSGGCEDHQVDLALSHPWCGTPPLPPPTFEIRHNSNDDDCEALISSQHRFDISGIRVEGVDSVLFNVWWKLSDNEGDSESFIYRY